MPSSKTLTTIIVILVAGLLISSTFAAYYLLEYQQAQSNSNTYLSELKSAQPTQTPHLLFDFGNGTSVWYNSTQVPTGASAYVATVLDARGVVNGTWYGAPYNEHLVTGIDNIQNTAQESWFVWTHNSTSSWQVAQVGSDELLATNGAVFAWTYCNFNSSTYAPSCSP